MDASIYYPSFRKFLVNISQAGNIYDNGSPTEEGLITYSVVTPVICVFGIFGNTLSLIVLNRRELKGSVYVYLAVLAFVDLCSSILLFFSGLSCGALFSVSSLPVYDVLLGLPLAIMFNTMGVFTTVMVSIDRICYLANPLRRRKPKFCHAYVARRTMVICSVLSIISSLPYCFTFASVNGEVVPRPFYFDRSYNTYNWVRFVVLGIIPSIFLIFGNGFLVYSLRKIKKIYGKCNNSMKCRKPQNYTNLTTTLILIVFIFVISQIPSMLVSRASASTFFFSPSSPVDTCNSKSLETVREISTVIMAISLSSDFILYYMFCPAFCKVLAKMFKRKKNCNKQVQMNVFVLDKQLCFDNNVKSIKELAAGKLFQMMDAEGNRDSLPSSIYDGSCDRSEEDADKPKRETLITLCSNIID